MKSALILTTLFLLALSNDAFIFKNNYFKSSGIHNLIKYKRWSCVDVVSFFLRRSAEYNSNLNALISINPNAYAEAVLLDEYYAKNGTFKGKLHCVPISVKDNIDVKSIPSTAGNVALRYSIPNKDALVIQRLRDEGAIFISKANLAELAMANYDSGTGGACKNPYDLTRFCGASSSGSGASTASGLAVISIGTDTGGSIIEPATYNGVFGFRPPYNLKSLTGIVPGITKQDTVGPLAKTLEDVVLTHGIMTADNELLNNFQRLKRSPLKNITIGYVKAFQTTLKVDGFSYDVDPEVLNAILEAYERLKKLNVKIVEIEIDQAEYFRLIILASTGMRKNVECGAYCKKYSFDEYLGDSERFGSDAPYHNFNEMFNSSLMREEFKKEFLNLNLNGSETCDVFPECEEYMSSRNQLAEIVKSWFEKYNLNAFTFPSIINLAFPLTPDFSFPDNISPTFLAPFTGYSSLNIPIAFSKPTESAPLGVPIGLNLLAPSEQVLNSFLIANRYEQKYLKNNAYILPQSTPLID